MVMLCNMDELKHLKWKWPFDPSDHKWPKIDTWPHNIESLKVMYMYESYGHAV